MEKLTPKQRMFAAEYRIDFNGTQAAIRAGYSPKTANAQAARLLTKVNIQEEIKQLQNERIEATGISADYVLNSLKSVAERCMQEEQVFDREGNPTGEYQFAHAGANKALELLGKYLKLFTDVSETKNKHEFIGWEIELVKSPQKENADT